MYVNWCQEPGKVFTVLLPSLQSTWLLWLAGHSENGEWCHTNCNWPIPCVFIVSMWGVIKMTQGSSHLRWNFSVYSHPQLQLKCRHNVYHSSKRSSSWAIADDILSLPATSNKQQTIYMCNSPHCHTFSWHASLDHRQSGLMQTTTTIAKYSSLPKLTDSSKSSLLSSL